MLIGSRNASFTVSARSVGLELGPGWMCVKTDMGSVRVDDFIPPRVSTLSVLLWIRNIWRDTTCVDGLHDYADCETNPNPLERTRLDAV